ncbi:hypothetical protein RhiirA5_432553 [Rhizophagus irregularis]|uniref:Uncharacterized protein n=1 Tax=Rhizophagus irregularis TaxID=588596 RepID=A0A2I1FDF9_9GLOM|nr:hypothetical protein RhiirA5_432553 [Rhizophagus irregularis]PKY32425.1 hypothetical protein RhiirB3_450600 [Rhizophagus irregularis]
MIFNVNENESKIHYAQKPMESFVDKCIPTNEAAAIHRQLLRALDYPGVHKLFKMLRPSYYHKELSNIHHTGDIMFKAYKEVGIEFAEKWIGFVFDSGYDMAKAQRLIREDLEIGEKVLIIPCMAHQTNILQLRDNIRIHSNLLITNGSADNNCMINVVNNTEFWKRLVIFIMILEYEQAT